MYYCLECDNPRHKDVHGCNEWEGELVCDECYHELTEED